MSVCMCQHCSHFRAILLFVVLSNVYRVLTHTQVLCNSPTPANSPVLSTSHLLACTSIMQQQTTPTSPLLSTLRGRLHACTCSEGLSSSHSTALLVMAIKLDFPTVWLQFTQVSSYTHTQLASVGIAGMHFNSNR